MVSNSTVETDVDTPNWLSQDTTSTTHCKNCGEPVSRSYVRVFGKTNEDLEHCHACKSRTERY